MPAACRPTPVFISCFHNTKREPSARHTSANSKQQHPPACSVLRILWTCVIYIYIYKYAAQHPLSCFAPCSLVFLSSLLLGQAEAAATAAKSWFTPFMSGRGLRCLAVLEDVWEAEVVATASAAGFDLVVTTAFRCDSCRRARVCVLCLLASIALANRFTNGKKIRQPLIK